jgi:hypothetical protein
MKHRCHWRYRDMIRKGKITATRYHLTNFVKDVGLAAKGDLDRIKVMCGNAP